MMQVKMALLWHQSKNCFGLKLLFLRDCWCAIQGDLGFSVSFSLWWCFCYVVLVLDRTKVTMTS